MMTATATDQLVEDSRQKSRLDFYMFGSVVVKVQQTEGVWKLTPHGQALGEAMAKVRHCLVGKTAMEIGVGTGVHAIAALKLGVHDIDVTDIDPAALTCAMDNADINGVAFRDARVENWMNFAPAEPYDLVLCNPPFCKAGTPDRRYFIKALIRESDRFVRTGGHLLFAQSSMADFVATEQQLGETGFYFSAVHEQRGLFREYYFTEPGFIHDSRKVPNGFEELDGAYIETLRVYLCTKKAKRSIVARKAYHE